MAWNQALMGSNMPQNGRFLFFTLKKTYRWNRLEPNCILDSGMIIKSYCQREKL
jgi:hypothetical protein